MTVTSQRTPPGSRDGGDELPAGRSETRYARSSLGVLRRWPGSRRSVRARLTAIYGSLFLACGAALLTITDLLVEGAPFGPPRHYNPPAVSGNVPTGIAAERHIVLHALLLRSGIALAIMALVSVWLGWVVAGRVLQLSQLADTIDGLLERLETAFDAQRRFVANASHELRTPLTTMRAALDVAIAKRDVPAQVRALDGNLRADLDHAERLVESFLWLARAQHGELGEQASVSLAQVAGDVLRRCGEAIAAKQIEVHAAFAPIRVTGSETLLTRMVDNVIQNAVRHNHTRGLINAACDTDGDKARLVVESGGPVLDERAVAQLARPFTRLGAERTGSQNGHGLGLSIVAAVATAHGGTLRLRARARGGLRVEITLPGATVAEPASVPA